MKLDLKKILKIIKLNENYISAVLGAIVVITVGILTINYFKNQKGEIISEAIRTSDKETSLTHVVVSGETLWSIAEDNYGSGYNWTDIKNANNLVTTNIEVGQELTLPQTTSKQPTITDTVRDQELSQNSIASDSYKVEKGDTLWNISVRAYGDGYRWVEIAKVNNLSHPNLIHSGNVLVLPR